MTAWVDANTIAAAVGLTNRAVRARISRGHWPSELRVGQGGPRLFVAVDSLPPHWQKKLEAAGAVAEVVAAAKDAIAAPAKPGAEPTAPTRTARERDEKLRALEAWHRHCAKAKRNGISKIPATEEFCRRWNANPRNTVGTSWNSLIRWAKLLAKGGPGALLRRATDKFVPLTPEDEALMRQLYLTQSGLSAAFCAELVRTEAQKAGRAVASPRTFLRCAQKMSVDEKVMGRKGKKAYSDTRERTALRDFNDPKLRTNSCWYSDHHQLDCFVLHPETGKPVRPWITLWTDFRSRKVVGWCVSLQPNSEVILIAFARAVLRYGPPEMIYVDNGKDYRQSELTGGRAKRAAAKLVADEGETPDQLEFRQSVMEHLGIKVKFAKIYNGRTKHIERTFGTMKGRFSRIQETYCGGKPSERPEQLAAILASGKVPTWDTMCARFEKYVEEVYNNHWQKGHGMRGRSPNVVYAERLEEKRWFDPGLLYTLLMKPSKPQKVKRHGLNLGDDWYWSDDIQLEQADQQVYFRYDPQDRSRVYVYTLRHRFLGEAMLRPRMSALDAGEELGEELRGAATHRRNATAGLKNIHAMSTDQILELSAEAVSAAAKSAPATPKAPVTRLMTSDVEPAERSTRTPEQARDEIAERQREGQELMRKVAAKQSGEKPEDAEALRRKGLEWMRKVNERKRRNA